MLETPGAAAEPLAAAARALHGCCAAPAGKVELVALPTGVAALVARLSHADGTVRATAAACVAAYVRKRDVGQGRGWLSWARGSHPAPSSGLP